jgi:hypothetical protein
VHLARRRDHARGIFVWKCPSDWLRQIDRVVHGDKVLPSLLIPIRPGRPSVLRREAIFGMPLKRAIPPAIAGLISLTEVPDDHNEPLNKTILLEHIAIQVPMNGLDGIGRSGAPLSLPKRPGRHVAERMIILQESQKSLQGIEGRTGRGEMALHHRHLLEDHPSHEQILIKTVTAQNVRNPYTNGPIGSHRLDDVAMAQFPTEPEASDE